MTKRHLLTNVLLLSAYGVGAHAEFPGTFSGTVTLTTDYVFRGISNTDESPAIQGSLDYAHPSGVYLGVWASNADVVPGTSIEIDYYGGYAGTIDALGYDLSALYYSYPGADTASGPDPDYVEAHAGLNYTFTGTPLTPKVGVGYNYSPDFFGEDGEAHYVNGTLDLSLPAAFGLGFEVGYQDVEGDRTTSGFHYTHWKIGVTKELKGFNFDLNYQDTDAHEFGDVAEGRVVFGISRSL